MKITILVENSVDVSFLLTGEHGLSILIEDGDEKVLFDTGQGMSILNNSQLLGIDLSQIKCIVLSHGHSDHTRGLKIVLEAVGKKEVYAHPEIFSKKYFIGKRKGIDMELSIGIPYERKEIEKIGNLFLTNSSVKVAERIWTSGEIPFSTDFEDVDKTFFVKEGNEFRPDKMPDDLALFLKSDKGYSIVLGCGHRGVCNTLEHISKITGGGEFHALIGGTHLVSADETKIEKTINYLEKYKFKKIISTHCTGFKASVELFKNFGEIYMPGSVGTVIEV